MAFRCLNNTSLANAIGLHHYPTTLVDHLTAKDHTAFPLAIEEVFRAPHNLLTLTIAALNHKDVVVIANFVAVIAFCTESTGWILEVGIVDHLATLANSDVPIVIDLDFSQIHGVILEGVGRMQYVFPNLSTCIFEEQTRVVTLVGSRAMPLAMFDIVGHVKVSLARRVTGHDHIEHLLVGVVTKVGRP